MRWLRAIARFTRGKVVPFTCLLVLVYFGYHALEGERGLLAWLEVSQRVEDASASLALVTKEREALERRVSSLRPESLDPDMLDERARFMLNLARPNEVVIYRFEAASQ